MASKPLDYQAPVPGARRPLGVAALVVPLVGAILGAALWATSPTFTGKVEPWDDFGFYVAGIVVSGFIAACFGPRAFWLAPVGIYVGQVAFVVTRLPASPAWVLGMGVGAVLSGLALLGAALPFVAYILLRRNVRET